MGKFNSFEEINSWQKARVFNKKVYLVTENTNFKKDFDFTRQIRRASISISSNIALKALREIQTKSLFTFYMLLKLPPEKFVLNYI
ncbi:MULTISPECIES: four helix bundle protein [unclassified Flavobacterium]|uniref:four helix bundle protein n=1 Tax=unclassified Flavobacterium TaxID=196869 RepID=UPI0021018E4C|nr:MULTISPECIES: four helix bundle protein [unclassified Flavobacterium]